MSTEVIGTTENIVTACHVGRFTINGVRFLVRTNCMEIWVRTLYGLRAVQKVFGTVEIRSTGYSSNTQEWM